jgi:hypothetical protein
MPWRGAMRRRAEADDRKYFIIKFWPKIHVMSWDGLVGYDDCLTRSRSRVRVPLRVQTTFLFLNGFAFAHTAPAPMYRYRKVARPAILQLSSLLEVYDVHMGCANCAVIGYLVVRMHNI